MANKMVVHCGGELATLEDLDKVEIPEGTATYHPVGHLALAHMIRTASTELLRLPLKQEHYALSKDGNRMFGMQVYGEDGKCPACKGSGQIHAHFNHAYEPVDPCPRCEGTGWAAPDFGLGVAFRNSYDKSMSIGVALGFNVFICDNLAISGEVNIIRKHTKNAWGDLDQILVHTLYRKRPQMEADFVRDVDYFREKEVGRERGWEFMGLLHGLKILSPTQLGIAFRAWNSILDVRASAWELYNVCTAAMKSTPFNHVMENHRELHHLIRNNL